MKREYLIGAGALLAILLALLYAFWPGDTRVETRETARAEAGQKRASRRVRAVNPAEKAAEAKFVELEDDPNIPVVTTTCKWIVTEERRNVPQWVMLDNLRDRGQKFQEDDIRCLTAAGVTPALLDFAERYQDQNVLQGKVGRAPGQ
ncbi:MAG: hypothetical protein H6737_12930 [Alphaproteobacteria bacterium]|nr:hypothetical protein [Alphaproteobacteria bacterium]